MSLIKIRLLEYEKHRNEITFRPFVNANEELKRRDIELVTGGDCTITLVGQASILRKDLPLDESIEFGLKALSEIDGHYIIVDGQDSTSLKGTIDVYRNSDALAFWKTSYLKHRFLYKECWNAGRHFWGSGGDYSVPDIDTLWPKMTLSGTNWLTTVPTDWKYPYITNSRRSYDIAALFSGNSPDSYEHGIHHSQFYNGARANTLNTVSKSFKVRTLENGVKLDKQQYFMEMVNSKITLAPYGYGEITIRDIEASIAGCVLLKPRFNMVHTIPNIFIENETYVAYDPNLSDLNEKIEYVLTHYDELYPYLLNNIFNEYKQQCTNEKTAEIFVKNLNRIGRE